VDYDPDARDHGLPHDPLKALIVPRPIGWISTMDSFGVVNLAPYSYFNLIAEHPAYVMFSSAGRKDSQSNAEETGEFVYNLVTEDLVDQVVACSEPFPHHVGEPEAVGVRMRPSKKVAPPAVAAAKANLECVYLRTIELPGLDGRPNRNSVIIGHVVHVHIDDAVIEDGIAHVERFGPVGRLGYLGYSTVRESVTRRRPILD
jgi:flavin reductase (DIM6/NTAB) family NADH-FMN oxidoreductase RutF